MEQFRKFLRDKAFALVLPACLLAAVVAVTRVLTGVHYPSDVLAGLAFGAGAAVIGFLL
jgi:membrane-associated phospholipid phosphatase